jgi:putative ABC transport system ATP-binding protein
VHYDHAIEARAVTKTFGSGDTATLVLRGIDFLVEPGEFVFLAGPSGSGKTTLLSILGCVLSPSSGSVKLLGEEIADKRESALPGLRLSYLGFVFQGHNLIASLTATQNITFQLELRGFSKRDATREAHRLLERVGLGDRRDHRPGELSGGQRQRVAIARALAGGPPLVLADEPTAALDAESGRLVTEMMRELAKERGHSVVVVTHDSRIYSYADRIVHIEDGAIVDHAV